jgi:hypothetical protein
VHNMKRRPVGTGVSPRGGHSTIWDATFTDQLPLQLGTPHAGNSSLLLKQGLVAVRPLNTVNPVYGGVPVLASHCRALRVTSGHHNRAAN